MTSNHQSKQVQKITALQHDDGSWGDFHSLSQPTKEQPMTTEQALRRLRVLGLTADDEPIRRALAYIERCFKGELSIPDRVEVKPDWSLFLNTMFAAWLRLFVPTHELATAVAARWAYVIENAFAGGSFQQARYDEAYRTALQPKGRRIDYFKSFVNFYPLALLPNALSPKTERRMFDYILDYPQDVYYIGYARPLRENPPVFASAQTSRYLATLELLAQYDVAPKKLAFAADWLNDNKDENGQWDLGAGANDGIYFPVSDSWRKAADRKRDCTQRIESLLKQLRR